MSRERLAETMVRREYAKKGKNLPDKFWNLPEYKFKYQNQLRFASKLYRTYSEEAIWNVITKEVWCFSLAAKTITPKIELEESKLKTLANRSKPKEVIIDQSLPAFRITKEKNLLDE